MKLGVLSDTHWQKAGHMNERIYEVFQDVEAILHAGDIVDLSVVEALMNFRPLYAVCGNCDGPEIQSELPGKRTVKAGRLKIGIIHGWRRDLAYLPELAREFSDVQVVIFGHSHIPAVEKRHGVFFFNPGSATFPRDTSPTVGILEIGTHLNAYHLEL
jgi:putative phosphoesterase